MLHKDSSGIEQFQAEADAEQRLRDQLDHTPSMIGRVMHRSMDLIERASKTRMRWIACGALACGAVLVGHNILSQEDAPSTTSIQEVPELTMKECVDDKLQDTAPEDITPSLLLRTAELCDQQIGDPIAQQMGLAADTSER